VKQLGGGAPVTVVAHSMGGAVLTRAGQLAPELIAHAVYLTALMPASGVPPAAYVRMPENEGSRVGALPVGDARERGAAHGRRVPGPGVPGGRARDLLRRRRPGDRRGGDRAADPGRSRGHQRGRDRADRGRLGLDPAYLRGVCTRDATIPAALQRKFIADADAAFPASPTAVRELEASHSPFLSMPGQVAGIVLDVLS